MLWRAGHLQWLYCKSSLLGGGWWRGWKGQFRLWGGCVYEGFFFPLVRFRWNGSVWVTDGVCVYVCVWKEGGGDRGGLAGQRRREGCVCVCVGCGGVGGRWYTLVPISPLIKSSLKEPESEHTHILHNTRTHTRAGLTFFGLASFKWGDLTALVNTVQSGTHVFSQAGQIDLVNRWDFYRFHSRCHRLSF